MPMPRLEAAEAFAEAVLLHRKIRRSVTIESGNQKVWIGRRQRLTNADDVAVFIDSASWLREVPDVNPKHNNGQPWTDEALHAAIVESLMRSGAVDNIA